MITLLLAFHNHQPVGNFGWVFDEAYRRAYRPLMELLERHPSIRFAQHYTGILLDWFETNHPDFLDLIDRSVAEGRTELLSGGYYEPILAMLPERDRQAQIRRLNRRIEELFETRPRGMWLAERVWEPSLPTTLAEAGLGYTILDDTHFKGAGLREEDLTGYFLTEDQGNPLAIFPIDQRLRYTIPFEPPRVTIDYLRSLDRPGANRVVVFADDGEKFGIWPDTYRTVYEEGWLEEFCRELEANADWIRTAHPSTVLAELPPAGRIYLPTGSYAEMLHWALPKVDVWQAYERFEKVLERRGLEAKYGSFVRGGFWRNFLVKYPEINAMQKKMLRISSRLHAAAEAAMKQGELTGSVEKRLEGAYDHLMAAQCNCPFWHGVFGGIYLANIRSTIHRELITADAMLDEIDGLPSPRLEVGDYDLDGAEEILFDNREVSLVIRPADGGSISEFDHKSLRYNFTDLVRRREEGYHERLRTVARRREEATGGEGSRSIHDIVRVKEEGLERWLVYDEWRRALLRTHFYRRRPRAADLRLGRNREICDIADLPFEASIEHEREEMIVLLRRAFRLDDGELLLTRRLHLDEAPGFRVEHSIEAPAGLLRGLSIGYELPISLSAGTEPDRYYEIDGERIDNGRADSEGETPARRVDLVDEWLGARVSITFDQEALLLRTPVETVSLSENGFERNYQGSLLLPLWPLERVAEGSGITVRIEQLQH